MKKINQGYVSLYNLLFGLLNTNGYVYYNPEPYAGEQIVGAFQPLVNIYNDIRQSRKPYKSLVDCMRDVLSPGRGCINVCKGALKLTASLIILTFATPVLMLQALDDLGTSNAKALKTLSNIQYPVSWVIDGACTIIRGLTQIIATPLISLRSIVRSFFPSKNVLFEDKKSIKKLITEARAHEAAVTPKAKKDKQINISIELIRRYHREVVKHGVPTNIRIKESIEYDTPAKIQSLPAKVLPLFSGSSRANPVSTGELPRKRHKQ